MIEETALEFLRARLDVPALMEVPRSPPGAFVVVEKTGSGRANHIKQANIAVQSYGASLLEAAQLDDKVVEVMQDFAHLRGIGSCKLLRDYNFTDTDTRRYRYQAVFAVTYY